MAGVVVAFLTAAPLGAQVTETPVAFDSVGRIRTLTPTVVARLGLTAPAWPAAGVFREARLLSVSTGGHVLAVERAAGAVDRYPLTDEALAALRAAVDAGVSRTGPITTEERADVVGESARGHFIRRQLTLAWLLYGPLAASLFDSDTESGSDVSSAVYLASVPASFFIVQRLSRNMQVTRAQSSLAFDGALRGAAAAWGALYLATEDDELGKSGRATLLGSALAGSIFAFKRGGRLTDGEAEATTTMSNLAALTGLGVLVAIQGDRTTERGSVAALLATGVPGYALGARYARQAGFGVTAGDVSLLTLGGVLGAMTAVTPAVDEDADARTVFTLGTLGLLGGAWIAHRTWARNYDHTTTEANLTSLGAIAGSLAGLSVIALGEPDPKVAMALTTGGAIAGAILGHGVANPARAGASRSPARDDGSVDVRLSNLAMAAAGLPGRHSVLTIRF